jgi:hypothetical protein
LARGLVAGAFCKTLRARPAPLGAMKAHGDAPVGASEDAVVPSRLRRMWSHRSVANSSQNVYDTAPKRHIRCAGQPPARIGFSMTRLLPVYVVVERTDIGHRKDSKIAQRFSLS